jgi:hypothetical protein
VYRGCRAVAAFYLAVDAGHAQVELPQLRGLLRLGLVPGGHFSRPIRAALLDRGLG